MTEYFEDTQNFENTPELRDTTIKLFADAVLNGVNGTAIEEFVALSTRQKEQLVQIREVFGAVDFLILTHSWEKL